MNSHRTIKEIQLRVDDMRYSSYELNERQLERIIAVIKQFSANVTSLKLHGFVLPINFILELLQQALKLESLSFTKGKTIGSVAEKPTMSQLPSLNALVINYFPGLLDIDNLIPAGSLTSIRYADYSTESSEVVAAILTKQHNIKSLTLDVRSNSDLTALRVDHLQLETLTFTWYFETDGQLVQLLKCQKNLKELRFINHSYLSGSSFQWICNNLKNLEDLEVTLLSFSIEVKAFKMLGALKQLRHFRPSHRNNLFGNGFESFQLKSDSIEKFEFGCSPVFSCGERLTKMVNSMAHNLPNLTHMKMRFEDISALCFVLGHCTKIIHLIGYISDPVPDQLAQQRFPNIQHLELYSNDEIMSQIMTWIARAMPNLKSMSLSPPCGLTFDVETMKEFTKESKSLENFYVDYFELHRELSTDDVVETIRRLTDQLKEYRIKFRPTYRKDLNFHKIKDILCNQFYVRDDYLSSFYLQKNVQKKYRKF